MQNGSIKFANPNGQKLCYNKKATINKSNVQEPISGLGELFQGAAKTLTIQQISDQNITKFLSPENSFTQYSLEDKLQLAMNLFYSDDPLKHPRIYQYIFASEHKLHNNTVVINNLNSKITELENFIKSNVTFNKNNTICKDQKQFERTLLGEMQKAKLKLLHTFLMRSEVVIAIDSKSRWEVFLIISKI